MNKMFVIARNTFREIIRDRILYGLVVFALLLLGLSLALGQLSFTEQGRIAIDFGMVGIQLGSVILAIFAGSSLVSKEIEKQTILTILSRPISRSQFLLGKYLGLVAVITVIVAGLSMVLFGIGLMIGFHLGLPFIVGAWGIFLEALILLAITLLFGIFVRPVLTVSCSLGLFLIGHWINNLTHFSQKSPSSGFKLFGDLVSAALPNLESFNWRSLVTYQDPIPWSEISRSSIYGLAWIVALLTVAMLFFRRKDFV